MIFGLEIIIMYSKLYLPLLSQLLVPNVPKMYAFQSYPGFLQKQNIQ